MKEKAKGMRMTSMRSLTIFILLTVLILSWANGFSQTVYRIRMPDSSYTAQLRGMTGTRTAGETVQGEYSLARSDTASGVFVFEFEIEKTGRYKLYTDPAGGNTYSEDTGWRKSGLANKTITGSDFSDMMEKSNASLEWLSTAIGDTAIKTANIDDGQVTLPKLSATVRAMLDSNANGTYGPDDVDLEFKLSPDTTIGIKSAYLKNRTNARFVAQYGDLESAIYDSGAVAVAGAVVGSTVGTEEIRDKTIYLRGNLELSFPRNYLVDYLLRDIPDTCGNNLFKAYRDSLLVIDGGVLYGHSDDNYVTGNVSSSPSGSEINLLDINVVEDSLVNWFVHITAGTGSGQCRRISSNVASGGPPLAPITTCTVTAAFSPVPDATSDYRLTPMNEYDAAIELKEMSKVQIKNMVIKDFAGDGIDIENGNDFLIANNSIMIPNRWFYSGITQNLVGRCGIALFAQDSIATCPDWVYYAGSGVCKYGRIVNNRIHGGLFAIDIEPYQNNTTVRDLLIAGNNLSGSSIGIALANNTTKYRNVFIMGNTFTDIKYCNLDLNGLGSDVENLLIGTNVFDASDDTTEYTMLIGSSAKHVIFQDNVCYNGIKGVEIAGGDWITVRRNTFKRFSNIGVVIINSGANVPRRVDVLSNDFIDCGYETGGYQKALLVSSGRQVTIQRNNFWCTDTTIYKVNIPFEVTNSDSVLVKDNFAYGHIISDYPTIYATTNYIASGNQWGFDAGTSSNVFDPSITLGQSGDPGDSTGAVNYDESKRVGIGFRGYWDTNPSLLSGYIWGQSYFKGYGGDPWRVQYTNLLFKTLNYYPRSATDNSLAMVLTGQGVGLGHVGLNTVSEAFDNKSYLVWVPADTAVSDSIAHKYVGHDSLREGFMDSAGVVKWRNRGQTSWTAMGGATEIDTNEGTIDTLINKKIKYESGTGGIYYNAAANELYLWADSSGATGTIVRLGGALGGIRYFEDGIEEMHLGCDFMKVWEPMYAGAVDGDGYIVRADSALSKWYAFNKHTYLVNLFQDKNLYLGVNDGGVMKYPFSIQGTTAKSYIWYGLNLNPQARWTSPSEGDTYVASNGDSLISYLADDWRTLYPPPATAGAIIGDGTDGRKLRYSYLTVSDGTKAASIKVEMTNLWNGNIVALKDSIEKNYSGTYFALSSDGTQLTIKDAAFTGTILATMANIWVNACTYVFDPCIQVVTGDVRLNALASGTGAAYDLTTFVDTSKSFTLSIQYLTSE